MALITDFLNLFKWDTSNAEDLEEEFDIDTAMNNNWDSINENAKSVEEKLDTQNTKTAELEKKTEQLQSALITEETEEATSIHVEDAAELPAKLEVRGNHTQKTREGYNIFNYVDNVKAEISGLTSTVDSEGYITVNGTAENAYVNVVSPIDINNLLEDGQTYTLWQENYASERYGGLYLQLNTKNISSGYIDRKDASVSKLTFTVDKSKYSYSANLQIGNISTFNNYKNRYMIYKGTDEKEYELPGVSPSIGYPSAIETVKDIEITHSNGTDSKQYTLETQQEMLSGDYFVKESDGWKEVHTWNKRTFTSGFVMQYGTSLFNLATANVTNQNLDNHEAVCNMFDFETRTSNMSYLNNHCFAMQPQFDSIFFKEESCTTAEEFNTKLAELNSAGNPLTVYYKAQNPIKLECTEEQSAVLEQLNNLDMYKYTNNIITADGLALLKLTYTVDTKKYIDSKVGSGV